MAVSPPALKTVMIQIRNVPDPLHRRLKSKAALEGLTLSDFLMREIRYIADRPTASELAARILSSERVETAIPVSEMIRGERPE